MIEYKCPKVIEKVPEVFGFKVGLLVILLGCALAFVVTVFTNFFISLIFLAIGGGYYYVSIKFPEKGELNQYIAYETGNHCIKMDQELKTIIRMESNNK